MQREIPKTAHVEKHGETYVETNVEQRGETVTENCEDIETPGISLICWIHSGSPASFLIFWMFATGAESVTLHLIAACHLTWEVGIWENQVC